MIDRQKIRDEISGAAMARWNQLHDLGMKGLTAGECADIAMRILDAHDVFAPTDAVLAEVWYYTDDEGSLSAEVYLNADGAKAAAIADLEAIDPGMITGEENYTWRTVEELPDRYLLDDDGHFTGWSASAIRVAAPAVKAGG